MATFEITTPDGTFEVTAPDEQTALKALQDSQGGGTPVGEMPSTGEDMAKAGASGIARGTADLIGLPGTIGDALRHGGEWAMRKGYQAVTGAEPSSKGGAVERFFAGPTPEVEAAMIGGGSNPLGGANLNAGLSRVTGGATDYKAKTTPGKYAGTVGEFLPGAVAFGGVGAGNALRFGVLPGVASEAAGQATEGTKAEPYARMAAALLSPALPNIARRAVTPFPASAERLAQARTMEQEGVNLTAGQRTGSDRLRYTESELGGMAGQRMMEQQGEQFTAAVLRRVGINANRATPDVIDGAFTQIGQQFDNLAANNRLIADRQLAQDLRATVNEYGMMVPPSARAPAVENLTNDIVQTIRQHGGIPGGSYQSLRSRLDRMARGAQADPQLSQALRGLRESLDDAMERSIAVNNPADIGAWRQARNQYRNMIVVERAATGAGEAAAAGIISPSALRNATVQKHGRRNYARGQGDFADLARAGEATMKPLPQSGTAPRTAARNLGASAMTLLGGGAGGAVGGGLGAVAGMVAGAALPSIAGRAILSRPGRAYLGNQAVQRGNRTMSPQLAAMFANLLARQSSNREKKKR